MGRNSIFVEKIEMIFVRKRTKFVSAELVVSSITRRYFKAYTVVTTLVPLTVYIDV